ncbi:hypothetical protein VNO78_07759 [Psophocarpus tetragonolobus]|uniref:Uncharacterized protein n=1 Tax=Psophocarpus tetragonolobus TaxID=3891 RepID=A0AAN9SUR9_PSOTE
MHYEMELLPRLVKKQHYGGRDKEHEMLINVMGDTEVQYTFNCSIGLPFQFELNEMGTIDFVLALVSLSRVIIMASWAFIIAFQMRVIP